MIRLFIKSINDARDGSAEGRKLLSAALFSLGINYEREKKYKAARGKEYLKSGAAFYSISHSCGTVCAAVSDREVGADCETLRDIPDHLRLAKRFFTSREYETVAASPDTLTEFLKIWTKKESYMKYTGLGFALPPSSFDTDALGVSQLTVIKDGAVFTVTGDGAENTEIITEI